MAVYSAFLSSVRVPDWSLAMRAYATVSRQKVLSDAVDDGGFERAEHLI